MYKSVSGLSYWLANLEGMMGSIFHYQGLLAVDRHMIALRIVLFHYCSSLHIHKTKRIEQVNHVLSTVMHITCLT